MWCPEGYLRWDEFRVTCMKAARKFFFERVLRQSDEKTTDDSHSEFLRVFRLSQATGRSWMVEALEDGAISCCSPDGICLRIDTQRLLSTGLWGRDYDIEIELINCARDWVPLSSEGEPPKVWLAAKLAPKPVFFDWETGMIAQPSAREARHLRRRIEAIPIPIPIPSSNAIYDGDVDWKKCWEQGASLATNFDGWALCVDAVEATKFVTRELEKLDARLRFLRGTLDQEESPLADDPNRVGRPRQRERDALVYLELFPNGHAPLQWKQAIRIIEQQAGIVTTAITIKRGLEELRQNPEQNPEQ